MPKRQGDEIIIERGCQKKVESEVDGEMVKSLGRKSALSTQKVPRNLIAHFDG